MIQEFTIPLHRFDLNLLPPEARKIGSDAFKAAVALHFAGEYAASGHGAIVAVDDEIRVMAYPMGTEPLDMVMPMLQSGRLREALPYLEALSKQTPEDAQVLYNLGICYSELGQFDEAIIRLKRAVNLAPKHVHAWVGIGTAYYRLRKPEPAMEAFSKALEINPGDPYVRRNLGGMLTALGRPSEAVQHLRLALQDLPDDPQAMFGLANALEEVGTEQAIQEASALYKRLITEHGRSPLAEMAEKASTALAHKRLRKGVGGGIRPDVVIYLQQALDLFQKVGKTNMQQIANEIAVLGRSGLDINDPTVKYRLKNLQGEFSALQLVSYLYAAFQEIDPSADMGADFAAEYAIARQT